MFVCVWGRYPPAAALLVRRLVVPVLNKLLQLPLHPLAGAGRVCSSSGKGPRGKTEPLARCLSPFACLPASRRWPRRRGGAARAPCRLPVLFGLLRDCARCLSTSCSRVVDRRFMRRTKVAAIDVGCLLSAVSPVTTFLRLSERVGGGAHRASEGSWSSRTSCLSWSS